MNQIAFKKNTITNNVDQSKVYTNGRYVWGPSNEPLTFPIIKQIIVFKNLLAFSKKGLEFSITINIYYRLKKENLSMIFTDFGTNYHNAFTDASKASIKNSAPYFFVDEYTTKRKYIKNYFLNELNKDFNKISHSNRK